MSPDFHPQDIERTAQAAWARSDAYRVTEDATRPKFYACSMLPYPSGKLHMGHVRNYTINDMMARYLRMQGRNVLMPMGWDAFGLPAENAAIANDIAPARWTRDNIADMKAQMQPLGLSIDWSREVATCDPGYYRWNQWFFLRLLEAGLAYKKTQTVNWDPIDQTVLANEQVIDGRGWRSGALVEKREIPGYYLAITRYADELLANVAQPEDNPAFLHGWPERVRLMQEHWIGRSVGVRLAFPHTVVDAAGQPIQSGRLWVFTTRADTLMGVTFCAVAPEHPLALHAAARDPAVAAFAAACAQGGASEAELATREKLGIATGLVVQHPLTGADVPVWIGNYVLMGYGDGAVMGVPAHDERDFAFAAKYGIDTLQVVAVTGEHYDYDRWQDWYGDKTRGVTINSDNFSGLSSAAAVDAIAAALAADGLGEKTTTWRLRDWGISRQRYWGTPIPIIHCDTCGDVPVPESDLPVVLPEDLIPDGSGNPLRHCSAFVDVACPRCGAPSKRETDTMDTFVDSSWYFMRYCCPDNDGAMVDARNDHWMPMDQYIGGIEHAVLHLLYARFWTKAMRDLGLVGFGEPFQRLFTQGMLLNESYFREDASGRREWYYPGDVEVRTDERGRPVSATLRADGAPVQLGGVEKMSKSKKNVVEPRDIINRYGADTARLFTIFAGPPDQSAGWSDSGAEGAHRFLRRLWTFSVQHGQRIAGAGAIDAATPTPAARDLRRVVHRLLQQITHDYDRLQYNTVVSGAMKLMNALEATVAQSPAAADDAANDDLAPALRDGMGILLRVLYPVAPHIAAVLWDELGYALTVGSVLDAPWPAVDTSALVQDTLTLVLQVNGKLRGEVAVPATADKADIEAAALASPEFMRFAEGRPPRKVIVVPGRLVNVVV